MKRTSIKNAAIVAGLSLGISLGAATYVVCSTQAAYAAVITNQQQENISESVPNATKIDPNNYKGEALVNNFYNKNYYTMPEDGAPVWHTTQSGEGEFTTYLSIKGNNGETYYSWAAATDYEIRTFIDKTHANKNTLELHVVYKNGDKDAYAGLTIAIDEAKTVDGKVVYSGQTLEVDPSRDIVVKSEKGEDVDLYMGKSWTVKDLMPAKKYTASNDVRDIKYFRLLHHAYGADPTINSKPIAANDTIELVVPLINNADPDKSTAEPGYNRWELGNVIVNDWSAYYYKKDASGNFLANKPYKNVLITSYPQYEWDKLTAINMVPMFFDVYSGKKEWVKDPETIKNLDPYYLGKISDQMADSNPESKELAKNLHWSMNGLRFEQFFGYRPDKTDGVNEDMRTFGFYPATTDFPNKLPLIFPPYTLRYDLAELEERLEKIGWTVEFRGTSTENSIPSYFYSYGPNNYLRGKADLDANTEFTRHVSVIPALLRNDKQHYWTVDSKKIDSSLETLPNGWSSASLLLHVFHADEPLGADKGTGSLAQADHIKELKPEEIQKEVADGTIKVTVEYHAIGETDENNVPVKNKKIDPNKAGVYKYTFERKFGKKTWIQTYQYVYIDEMKEETAEVDRNILLHKPSGLETISQKSSFKRTVKTDAETGEKTPSEWKQTGSIDAYTPDDIVFEGETWKPDKNAEAVEVNPDSDPADVDIYYHAQKSEGGTTEEPQKEKKAKPAAKNSALPKTGDVSTFVAPFALGGLSSVAAFFGLSRRKKK